MSFSLLYVVSLDVLEHAVCRHVRGREQPDAQVHRHHHGVQQDHGHLLQDLTQHYGENVGPDGAGNDEEGAEAVVNEDVLLQPGQSGGEDGAHAKAHDAGADLQVEVGRLGEGQGVDAAEGTDDEAAEEDADGPELQGGKDGQEPHEGEAAPEDGCDAGALAPLQTKLAQHGEGGEVGAEAVLDADVEEEEEREADDDDVVAARQVLFVLLAPGQVDALLAIETLASQSQKVFQAKVEISV